MMERQEMTDWVLMEQKQLVFSELSGLYYLQMIQLLTYAK